MNIKDFALNYLDELIEIRKGIDLDAFEKITGVMLAAYKEKRQIFVFGNGGSASTASHLACDINKCACENRDKKFRVISLADNIPTMLAIANDINYESIFSEQIKNYFQEGDIAIGISGSGNSENVLRAIEYCNKNKGTTIGITGFQGGRLASMVEIPLVVPSNDMQKIEDYHMIIVHILMRALKETIEQD